MVNAGTNCLHLTLIWLKCPAPQIVTNTTVHHLRLFLVCCRTSHAWHVLHYKYTAANSRIKTHTMTGALTWTMYFFNAFTALLTNIPITVNTQRCLFASPYMSNVHAPYLMLSSIQAWHFIWAYKQLSSVWSNVQCVGKCSTVQI